MEPSSSSSSSSQSQSPNPPLLLLAMSSSALLHRRQRRRVSPSAAALPFNSSVPKVIGNDDLLKQILVRLPAKPLFSFKAVSHRWLSLISDPYLMRDWIAPKSPSAFYYRSVKICQSCNGLLLCSSSRYSLDYVDAKYYVLNPTTKKYSIIPRPVNGDERNFVVSMTLIFDPSVSPDYNILVVRARQWRGVDFCVALYSSSTRTWVFSGLSFTYLSSIIFENGVFLDGKIYWPTCLSEISIYYDCIGHRFVPYPMPHGRLTKELLHFGEFGGHLQLVEFHDDCIRYFQVLELKADCSKWFVKHRIDLHLGVVDFPEMYTTYNYNMLCFLGGDDEGDSCLVFYVPGKVIAYSFKDKIFKKLCDLKLRPCDFDSLRLSPWFAVHSCVETIYNV
ncbi:F-box protein At5g07610-like [Camellia sinensis]|uniref:F-box protein At5g07610-like n=1 Tax=Camellia sinensis TaxID=4442 RepID=UPI0010366FC1|nr:F-box protein At5g07610-like [Camellia sinensis]